jgi:small subunit ribosomal protein S3
MVQKVNPISNRLGIIKGWDSIWFGVMITQHVFSGCQNQEYLNAVLPKPAFRQTSLNRTLKLITVTVNTAAPHIIEREDRRLTN